MSVDGAALLAAAVRAACQAKAPRRTVQAVAAAVTGVLVRPMAEAVPRQRSEVPAGVHGAPVPAPAEDPAVLVDTLRAARRAQRARKKVRRREAKQAASLRADGLAGSVDSRPRAAVPTIGGAAGRGAESWGDSAERPAQAPPGPPAGDAAPGVPAEGPLVRPVSLADPSSEPPGIQAASVPSVTSAHTFGPSEIDDTDMAPRAASAGKGRAAPYAASRGKSGRHGKGPPAPPGR
ncbi:unnamed protein product [Prorocentrum cordatum]|uniref:Uncharacterized protein n=1 Tax=Prorocentrum cordatum TaxID=2364126 RepID=A0ABN9TCR3_9DINO|nr:unnamed protein product [Polarella glacialis]